MTRGRLSRRYAKIPCNRPMNMTTAEHPVTRTELREELRHYATKADLANLETRLIKWMVGLMVSAVVAASAVAVVIQNIIG